jgi:hypothetical protein
MPRRKPKNRGGRPSKFTTPAVVAIAVALGDGAPLDGAAKAAGIGVSTLYRWLNRARSGDLRYGPLADLVSQARWARQTESAFDSLGSMLLKARL